MENKAALFEELIRKTSHDVRTPLTSIAGFADLIAEDATVPDAPREFAGIIKEEVKKLAQTLEEFFDKIKSEEDNMPS